MRARGNWTWVALLAVAVGSYVAGAHRAPTAAAGPTAWDGHSTCLTNSEDGKTLTIWTLENGRVIHAAAYTTTMAMNGNHLISVGYAPMSPPKPEGK